MVAFAPSLHILLVNWIYFNLYLFSSLNFLIFLVFGGEVSTMQKNWST